MTSPVLGFGKCPVCEGDAQIRVNKNSNLFIHCLKTGCRTHLSAKDSRKMIKTITANGQASIYKHIFIYNEQYKIVEKKDDQLDIEQLVATAERRESSRRGIHNAVWAKPSGAPAPSSGPAADNDGRKPDRQPEQSAIGFF